MRPLIAETDPTRSQTADGSHEVHHAAAGAAVNLLTILGAFVQAAFHPLAARVFGIAAYGVYRWVLSSADVLLRLSPLGTDFALLRHIPAHRAAGEPHLERATLRTAIWMTLITSSVIAAIAIALASPIARLQGTTESAVAIRWLALALPFTSLATVLIYATLGAKTTRYNFLVKGVAQPIVLLTATIAVGAWARSLGGLCGAYFLAMAMTCGFSLWAVAHVFGRATLTDALRPARSRHGDPFLHMDVVRFSIPMGLSESVNALLQRTDLILLGFLAPPETLGIYAGAEFISRAVSTVRYAFDPVASPMMAEAIQRHDHARFATTLRLMTRWVALLTTPLFVAMLVAREPLLVFFPAATGAGAVLVVMMLGHLLDGYFGLSGYAIAMSGRSGLALANNLLAAAVNIVLCLVLVPRVGAIGAAVAAAAGFTALQALQVVEVLTLWRTLPFSAGFVKAIAAGAAAGLVGEHLRPAGADIWSTCAATAAAMLVYGGVVFSFGLAAEERAALRQAAGSISRATTRPSRSILP